MPEWTGHVTLDFTGRVRLALTAADPPKPARYTPPPIAGGSEGRPRGRQGSAGSSGPIPESGPYEDQGEVSSVGMPSSPVGRSVTSPDAGLAWYTEKAVEYLQGQSDAITAQIRDRVERYLGPGYEVDVEDVSFAAGSVLFEGSVAIAALQHAAHAATGKSLGELAVQALQFVVPRVVQRFARAWASAYPEVRLDGRVSLGSVEVVSETSVRREVPASPSIDAAPRLSAWAQRWLPEFTFANLVLLLLVVALEASRLFGTAAPASPAPAATSNSAQVVHLMVVTPVPVPATPTPR
jgi:hypothetical protein